MLTHHGFRSHARQPSLLSSGPANRAPQVYPELYVAAANTQKAVAGVRDGDKREDLKLLANMYFNTLQAQLNHRTCALSLPPDLQVRTLACPPHLCEHHFSVCQMAHIQPERRGGQPGGMQLLQRLASPPDAITIPAMILSLAASAAA